MILVCHPDDSQYIEKFYRRHPSEQLVVTERCPRQTLVYLSGNLSALVRSGAWFDEALEASTCRIRNDRQSRFVVSLDSGTDRCLATNADGVGQCSNATKRGASYCKKHLRERSIWIERYGEGFDEDNDNPLSMVLLGELNHAESRLRFIADQLGYVPGRVAEGSFSSESLERHRTELVSLADTIRDIVSGDRERDRRQRGALRARIQRMIQAIEKKYRHLDGREIHNEWISLTGLSHDESSIQDLKDKIDWLYATWEEAFAVDEREWIAPGRSGAEPGEVKRVRTQKGL